MASLLFLVGQGHSIWENLEPYVAGIIREMAASGDWLVPTLNGHPFLEKPPLFYAMAVVACKVMGSFEPWAMRLPSALLAIATVIWSGYLGYRLRSGRAGIWSGLLVASSYLFFRSGHGFEVDILLIATTSFALGASFLAVTLPLHRPRWISVFWFSLGFVFLSKGVFGLVLTMFPLGVFLLMSRNLRLAKAFFKPSLGMFAAFCIILAWTIALAFRGGWEFLVEVFVRNSIGRFTGSPSLVPVTGRLGEHASPWYFYLLNTPGSVAPWTIPWILALWQDFPKRLGPWHPRRRFVPVLFVAGALLLSASLAKRTIYLAPLIPISLVHASVWLDRKVSAWKASPGTGKRVWLRLGVILPSLAGMATAAALAFRLDKGRPTSFIFLLLAGLPALWILRTASRHPACSIYGAIAQWHAILLAFAWVVVPLLDLEWAPAREPYRISHSLSDQGAQLFASRLGEAFTGYATWELGHPLRELNTVEAVEAEISRPSPVVILASREFWRKQLQGRCDLVEVPIFSPRDLRAHPKLMERTPCLLVNINAARGNRLLADMLGKKGAALSNPDPDSGHGGK